MKAISAALLAFLVGCSAQEPERSRDTAPESVAETVSDHPAISRIAFGSCAFQWTEQPIFGAVVAVEPDLYLSLGDAIYGDFDGENTFDVTPESLREEW